MTKICTWNCNVKPRFYGFIERSHNCQTDHWVSNVFQILFKYLPLFSIWNFIQPVKRYVEFVVSILLNTVFQDLLGHHFTINWSHFLSLIAYFSPFSVREWAVVRVSKKLQVPSQENIASNQNRWSWGH